MNEVQRLRNEVCDANRSLARHSLSVLTWGNVSGLSADGSFVAIKPSGVAYEALTPDDIVVLAMDGEVIAGKLRPSTDTPTHLLLYRHFAPHGIRAIAHTHSACATAFCQARKELECLGTTHADHFAGTVPLTRPLHADEMHEYELATGRTIIEAFGSVDPRMVPGVLVVGHAPFTWGPTSAKAVENAVALEAIAAMAIATLSLSRNPTTLEPHILAKHHERKHGAGAYYGQR